MKTKLLTALLLGSSVLGLAGTASAADVTLNIESWRGDDLAIWKDKLIPAFEAKNPGIKVVFAPSAPTEYDAALDAVDGSPPSLRYDRGIRAGGAL